MLVDHDEGGHDHDAEPALEFIFLAPPNQTAPQLTREDLEKFGNNDRHVVGLAPFRRVTGEDEERLHILRGVAGERRIDRLAIDLNDVMTLDEGPNEGRWHADPPDKLCYLKGKPHAMRRKR